MDNHLCVLRLGDGAQDDSALFCGPMLLFYHGTLPRPHGLWRYNVRLLWQTGRRPLPAPPTPPAGRGLIQPAERCSTPVGGNDLKLSDLIGLSGIRHRLVLSPLRLWRVPPAGCDPRGGRARANTRTCASAAGQGGPMCPRDSRTAPDHQPASF